MRCLKCGSDNREGRKFCTNCGVSLSASCPKCGAAGQPDEKFCGECGTALTDAPALRAEEAGSVIASAGGERRHLTVLFCDLVGSTEIAARLDPEEWRELVASYHRAAAQAITRYGGHVAKYLGDGVMAYFGWPKAHENDAERASRAGLAMLVEVAKFNQQSTYPKVSVRVGIDSGIVVVGAGAGKDTDVFGEAPNIAARVQSAAAPDTVLLTAAAHRLVSGLFVVEDLGAHELKGIASPVELYRVLRPTGVRGRLAVAHGLTSFVGREESLLRSGIDTLLEIGNRLGIGRCMTYLASAQSRAGAVADALETVEQALNFNPQEVLGRPETLRLRGELRLKQSDRQLAEADFRDSIAMARSMDAKAWELRTTMSLARLLGSNGRCGEARKALAEIYNWFTEGFDLPDLKEARVLLEDLSQV